MKKIISIALACFSISTFANSVENSSEYKEKEKKFNTIQVNQIFEGNVIEKIDYIGEEWFLVSENKDYKRYIQVDPETNVISRLRVVSEYSVVDLGKDIKFLEYSYGETKDHGADFLIIEKDNLRIRLYTDFDLLNKDYSKMYSIIDFLERESNKKRKESIHNIYYNNRMIRR
tara:strand:+ start:53528 stop:54046 length:519 start_codon:yes stop_codon:yes gene_type:complete